MAPPGSSADQLDAFGHDRYVRGDNACAVRSLHAALRRKPRHQETALVLGMALGRLGDLRRATEALAKAARLDPNDAQARRKWVSAWCC